MYIHALRPQLVYLFILVRIAPLREHMPMSNILMNPGCRIRHFFPKGTVSEPNRWYELVFTLSATSATEVL